SIRPPRASRPGARRPPADGRSLAPASLADGEQLDLVNQRSAGLFRGVGVTQASRYPEASPFAHDHGQKGVRQTRNPGIRGKRGGLPAALGTLDELTILSPARELYLDEAGRLRVLTAAAAPQDLICN